MTPTIAAWIRNHAWPARLRDQYARAEAHPELAAEDYGCVCQLGPSHWCRDGQHHDCPVTYGSKVPATELATSDGMSCFRTPDGRVVNVWLADRACQWRCPCDCHRTVAPEPQQLDLFEAVAA